MTRAIKVVIVLIVIAGGAVMGGLLANEVRKLRLAQQQLEQRRQEVAAWEAKQQALTVEVDSLKTERASLQDRLDAVRKQLDSVTKDLERARASADDAANRNQQLRGERAKLETQVAALTSQRDEAKQAAQRLEREKAELERSLSRMRERQALLDRDYRLAVEKLAKLESAPPPRLDIIGGVGPPPSAPRSTQGAQPSPFVSAIAGTVELPPIVVRKGQAGIVLTIRGRLLDVNEPQRFVVIDRGGEDGVREGMAFDILRGAIPVGRVTAIRVRPTLSACDIDQAKTPGPLQIGDLAVQSGS